MGLQKSSVRIIARLGKYLGLGSNVAGTQCSCAIETVRNNDDQLWDMIKSQALTVEIILRIISSVRKPRRMDGCMDGIQSLINAITTTTENLQTVKYFVTQTSKPLHPDTV